MAGEIYRIAILGVPKSGKTTFVQAQLNNHIREYHPTPVDYKINSIDKLDPTGKKFHFEFYDCTGKDEAVPRITSKLTDINLFLIVLDVTQNFEMQFQYLKNCVDRLHQSKANPHAKFKLMLMRTKINSIVVTKKEIEFLFERLNLLSKDHIVQAKEIESFLLLEAGKNKIRVAEDFKFSKEKLSIDLALQAAKVTVRRHLDDNYISFLKLPLFGHHHDQRARRILHGIEAAQDINVIVAILNNQLALFEGHVDTAPYNPAWEFDLTWSTYLKNRPEKPETSGYYRQIKAALIAIQPSIQPSIHAEFKEDSRPRLV
jgi:GTPase SAR1 family protein